ncbi:hypothetical protein F3Y22_tig00018060pilonHSYRG00006 [Hibiscus syriacus]|uniref:FAM192A/Fyv6 N-terminal domain-containing protein n=1 Tax=Hibiscus syriacus TaxID=106335 RepID=A0A6A3BZK3_HIBSY|nr:hypothetical protein F3Y22_tig00018060pilonHSYRG00006 [Hibiscus syriacus]
MHILKENKDKKDAEFNERFKHRPPKALDEDETEFLDKLERSRREYERQVADEEAEQLRTFQAAVAAQSNIVLEVKETLAVPASQEQKLAGKENPATRPLGMTIKVKPQAKRAKTEPGEKLVKAPGADNVKSSEGDPNKSLRWRLVGWNPLELVGIRIQFHNFPMFSSSFSRELEYLMEFNSIK